MPGTVIIGAMEHRIPVTLLTGFLGSGKTTLLSRLLRHPHLQNTAVVINEIGEAGLDHLLVRTVEDTYIAENTLLLSSGCLCCTLRTELADTLRDLYFRRMVGAVPPFERLVIETTGLADPGPILAHLMNERVIAEAYQLDAVIVTVDGMHGIGQLATHAEARKQAAVADVLLLTKSDLAAPAQSQRLAEALRALNPDAKLHSVSQGMIDPAHIFDTGLFDAEQRMQPQRWLPLAAPAPSTGTRLLRHKHGHEISSLSFALPPSLLWSRLQPLLEQLCQAQGENLYRLKGIVYAADKPAPLAIHAVQHTLYPPTELLGWREQEPASRMVLIGKGLDETHLRGLLEQAAA